MTPRFLHKLSQFPSKSKAHLSSLSFSSHARTHGGGGDSDTAGAAPKLLVVQPRIKSETLLRAKLNEALNLANSLEEQRDGFFETEMSEKGLPPSVVVHNPVLSRKCRADTFFGTGTLENIKCHGELDAVFVNAILSGTQQRNLERAWGKPVLDRVGLIIQIFNAHAYTKEAKLQAELAALMYQKTRLVRVRAPDGRYTFGALGEAEVVSARGRGGSGSRGFLSGAGETELELQRRRISERRMRLLAEIEEVRRTRALQRASRKRRGGLDGQGLATVAVVGYTNAGKSTLVSVLSDSDLYSDDRLFATVDPRVRSVALPTGRTVLLSDTVGFISDLPVQLVEAFHATLEEVVEADILVHVLDSSAPDLKEQRSTVLQVLKQIGVSEEKIQNMIEVWNKIDVQENLESGEYVHDYEVEADEADGFSEDEEDGIRSKMCAGEDEPLNGLGAEEGIEDGPGVYSDGWLASEDEKESSEDQLFSKLGWVASDEQQGVDDRSSVDGKDSDSHTELQPHVKISALMGVGLQELLELIDEKLDIIDKTQHSTRKFEPREFNRKWRPPRVEEDPAVAVE
ncbi:GTP-binding protein, chloroplastic-like protein [Drosera capensis]